MEKINSIFFFWHFQPVNLIHYLKLSLVLLYHWMYHIPLSVSAFFLKLREGHCYQGQGHERIYSPWRIRLRKRSTSMTLLMTHFLGPQRARTRGWRYGVNLTWRPAYWKMTMRRGRGISHLVDYRQSSKEKRPYSCTDNGMSMKMS